MVCERKLPKQEIKETTDRFLKLMKIEEYRARMPENYLRTKQRVALARAYDYAKCLLMDEPLSNPDAKGGDAYSNKEIQNTIGITTVYVTHDQEEAMAVSDRIAVMNLEISQIGTPKVLYQRPQSICGYLLQNKYYQCQFMLKMKSNVSFPSGYACEMDNILDEYKYSQKVIVSVRPEELVVDIDYVDGIKAVIDDAVFLGLNTHYFVHTENGDKLEIIQESKIDSIIEKGTEIYLHVKEEKINIFDENGDYNLVEGVVNDLDLYTGD